MEVPFPTTNEEWDYYCDMVYDAGFYDGYAGAPRRYAGDLQFEYDQGYEDGEASR